MIKFKDFFNLIFFYQFFKISPILGHSDENPSKNNHKWLGSYCHFQSQFGSVSYLWTPKLRFEILGHRENILANSLANFVSRSNAFFQYQSIDFKVLICMYRNNYIYIWVVPWKVNQKNQCSKNFYFQLGLCRVFMMIILIKKTFSNAYIPKKDFFTYIKNIILLPKNRRFFSIFHLGIWFQNIERKQIIPKCSARRALQTGYVLKISKPFPGHVG